MTDDTQPAQTTRTFLYVTFHGGQRGASFDSLAAAKRYPGPRGLECADKAIVRLQLDCKYDKKTGEVRIVPTVLPELE